MTGYLLNGILHEGVAMEKPECYRGDNNDIHCPVCKPFCLLLTSSPQLPAIGFKVKEGVVEYEKQKQGYRLHWGQMERKWENITDSLYDACTSEEIKRIVAIPVKEPSALPVEEEARKDIEKAGAEYVFKNVSVARVNCNYIDDADLRAFVDGFEFKQWLNEVSMTHSDIPLHIKYRMYFNQEKIKKVEPFPSDKPESEAVKEAYAEMVSIGFNNWLAEQGYEFTEKRYRLHLGGKYYWITDLYNKYKKIEKQNPAPLPVNEAAKEYVDKVHPFVWPKNKHIKEQSKIIDAFLAGYAFRGENKKV